MHIKKRHLLAVFEYLYQQLDLEGLNTCCFGDTRFYYSSIQENENKNNIKLKEFNEKLSSAITNISKIKKDEWYHPN